jgi:hypothetical protein
MDSSQEISCPNRRTCRKLVGPSAFPYEEATLSGNA